MRCLPIRLAMRQASLFFSQAESNQHVQDLQYTHTASFRNTLMELLTRSTVLIIGHAYKPASPQ